MKDAGYAHMGVGRASGKDKAEQAAAAAIASPLLETSINGARGVIVNITASSDVGLDEVDVASSMIQASAHPDVNLIWGVAYDESMQDEMQVTVIATGFDNDKNFDIPAYTFKSPAKSAAAPAPRQEEAKEVQDDDDDNGFIDIMEIFRSKK